MIIIKLMGGLGNQLFQIFTLISLSVLISIHIDPYDNFYPESSAGFIGLTLKKYSLPYLSIIGSTIVAIFFLLISFTLTANLSWKNLISGIQDKLINSSYFLSKVFKDGLTFFKKRAQPVIVPPVPTPVTNPSKLLLDWSHIS